MSHWEKRQLVSILTSEFLLKFHHIIQVKELGLKRPSFSVMELLKVKQHGFLGITFIEWICSFKCGVKRYVHLSEIDDSNSLVVNENTGYYVVKEEDQLSSIHSVMLHRALL